MLSDLITVLETIALFAVCIYGLKTRFKVIAVIILVLATPPVLITIAMNFPVLYSPLTQEIHGRVVDAETQKPLAGVNIKAGWYEETASVGGVGGRYYKVYKTVTDGNGYFTLPRQIKPLKIQIPPLFPITERDYAGINIVAYTLDYAYMIAIEHIKFDNQLNMKMKKFDTGEDFMENIRLFCRIISSLDNGRALFLIKDPNELRWLRQAYFEFDKRFPTSRADRPYFDDLPNWLDENNAPESLPVKERLAQKYPNADRLRNIEEDLNYLRNKYKH